jgi:hypothetical protein
MTVFNTREVVETLPPSLAGPKIVNTPFSWKVDGGVNCRETVPARVERRFEEFCGKALQSHGPIFKSCEDALLPLN